MDERMTVLNARIDELKAKIAKDRAAHQYGAELYESRYANDPRYRAGMIDYILSGDRGGLDSFASTIQSYDAMKQQKEMAELNNALIRKQQEAEAAKDLEAKMVRLNKLRNSYIAQRDNTNLADAKAVADLNNLALDYNALAKELGRTDMYEPVAATETPVSPFNGLTQGQLETLIKANLGYKDRTDEQETEFESLLGALKDKSVAEEYRSQRSKLGETVEGKKRAEAKRVKEINDAIDAAIKASDEAKLPKGHSVRTFEDPKDGKVKRFVAKKNADDKWVPVKAWGK